MKANKETIKTCYSCKERNPISKMTLMGLWVCNKCLNKSKK